MTVVVFMLLMLSSLAALLILTVQFGKGQAVPDNLKHEPDSEERKKYIIWKSFYVNPNDPRGWVPKTNNLGYTVNLRTKKNAAIFAVLIALTSAFAIGMAVTACSLP